jgi:hypothetical protein
MQQQHTVQQLRHPEHQAHPLVIQLPWQQLDWLHSIWLRNKICLMLLLLLLLLLP